MQGGTGTQHLCAPFKDTYWTFQRRDNNSSYLFRASLSQMFWGKLGMSVSASTLLVKEHLEKLFLHIATEPMSVSCTLQGISNGLPFIHPLPAGWNDGPAVGEPSWTMRTRMPL